jgi:hypothetical protein
MTNSFYFSDLIDIPVNTAYAKAAKDKELKQISYALYSALTSTPPKKEAFLPPVTVFENAYVYDDVKNKKEFIISLGIFDLDTSSATATVIKDNKLEITWTERAGKGKFTSTIPSYLVATSAPVLSYKGGVLDIRVPVESRSKNEAVFVGKLIGESK